MRVVLPINNINRKICFVVSLPLTAQAFLLNHFKLLSKEYDIYLVVNIKGNEYNMIKELPVKGYKNIAIERKINLYNDLKSFFVLWFYFIKMNFFAVHSITPKAGLITSVAAYFARVPNRIHIYTGQVWYTKKGLLKIILIYCDKIISRLNNKILVDGNSQRQFIIEKGIIKKNKSLVLGKGSISGVDINKFKPDLNTKNRIRKELNIDESKIVFIFFGRQNYDKGIYELFEAFNNLVEKLPNSFLLIVGYDEENVIEKIDKYKNIVDKINIMFYGPAIMPEKFLQASDIFCLPSHREGFGTSVIEASACGLPVICSDTYGLLDAMQENETGLRHKANDSISLYNQMLKLASDSNLRKKLGANGINYCKNYFSSVDISKEWLNYYNSLK